MRQGTFYYSILFTLLWYSTSPYANAWQDIVRQFPQVVIEQWRNDDQIIDVMVQPHQRTQAAGTLILLPDMGQHAFYPSWFKEIQQSYPAAGWQVVTLPVRNLTIDPASLANQQQQLLQQLQVLNHQALPRPWLLISQGENAALVINLLSETTAIKFDALVSINAFFSDLTLHRQLQPVLSDPRFPVLDLITGYSHPWALAYAPQRLAYARSKQNSLYRQRLLDDIRVHPMQTPVLVKELFGWQRAIGF